MTSTTNDSYRVFSNNVSSPWVVDGKINVDDSIKTWVDMSKEMVDNDQTGTADLWSEDWSNLSEYDQGCNESFQLAMKEYFEGNASYDDALQAFFKAVGEKYPELSY